MTWKAEGCLLHPFALALRLQVPAPKTSYSLPPSTIASTGRDKREREGGGKKERDFFLGPDYGVMKSELPQYHPETQDQPSSHSPTSPSSFLPLSLLLL